ncbi:bacterioferritin-associated ferredoxin [Spongiibacter marinus]|jgi:bacterioferritin-associated ferredoxin|uniref:bacterioferritin-associated ferredoxin n=1 Tax=Spongiibacter marinus TaxID=354246 RepID=UPI0003FF0D35|nr:bacterioferritin-associated ferredoxin [Spongiibacter marinus]MBM7422449.1 bacterioferritin-associated ferredoxin [Spongiibacter marinus]MEE2653082.1 bacterioferritin-associated ferredoxin [Pseudomonadota bacterium]
MYVCLCKGITDTQIREAMDNGTSSFRELRRELDLASQCGKCGSLARSVFDAHLSNYDESLCYAVA